MNCWESRLDVFLYRLSGLAGWQMRWYFQSWSVFSIYGLRSTADSSYK